MHFELNASKIGCFCMAMLGLLLVCLVSFLPLTKHYLLAIIALVLFALAYFVALRYLLLLPSSVVAISYLVAEKKWTFRQKSGVTKQFLNVACSCNMYVVNFTCSNSFIDKQTISVFIDQVSDHRGLRLLCKQADFN